MGSLHRYRRTAIVALGLCLFSMTPARGAPVRGARRVPHLFTRVLTVRGMGDAATDTLYTFDGTHVTRQDFARGTLAQDGALAGGAHSASAPCAENVTCGRLTYRWTKCFQIADGYSHAYQCFHVYAAGTTSKTLAYRVGWWTGTANSHAGSNLTAVTDRNDMSGCPYCGVRIIEWSPSGDTHPPDSGRTIDLGFGVSGVGVNATIGEHLTVYAQAYGPQGGYPTGGQFRFMWAGNVGPGTSIGMGGGDEWQYRRSAGYPWLLSITNTVCYPSWLC